MTRSRRYTRWPAGTPSASARSWVVRMRAPPWSTVLLAHIAFVYGHDTIRLVGEGSRISSALIASTSRSGFVAATAEYPAQSAAAALRASSSVRPAAARRALSKTAYVFRGSSPPRATSALAPIVSAAPHDAGSSIGDSRITAGLGRPALRSAARVRPVSPPTITIMSASPRASRSPSSPTNAIGVLPPQVVSTEVAEVGTPIASPIARPGFGWRNKPATTPTRSIEEASIPASTTAAAAARVINWIGSVGLSRSGSVSTIWARPTMTGVRAGTGIRVG